jgi:hypothetical protein
MKSPSNPTLLLIFAFVAVVALTAVAMSFVPPAPVVETPVAPQPEVKPKPSLDMFNGWFGEHRKACAQCESMESDPNVGFCLEAFRAMQWSLQNPGKPLGAFQFKDREPITPSPVSPVSEPDAPPLSAPVSSSCSGGNGAAPRASSRVVIRVRPRWRLFGRGR